MATVKQEDKQAVWAFCADTNEEWATISKEHPELPASALYFAAELREERQKSKGLDDALFLRSQELMHVETALREAKEALAIKEELKADPRDASQTAMDEIQEACGYYKEPWEYPGQVVRDVRRMRGERDVLRAENEELKRRLEGKP